MGGKSCDNSKCPKNAPKSSGSCTFFRNRFGSFKERWEYFNSTTLNSELQLFKDLEKLETVSFVPVALDKSARSVCLSNWKPGCSVCTLWRVGS